MVDFLRQLIGRYWGSLNWGLYEFLVNPRLVTLLLLGLMVLLWVGSHGAWRKRGLRVLVGVLAFYWLVISPPVATLTEGLLMGFVPPDRGESADAIVVIGRGEVERGDRYPVALQLLEQGRSSRLFVTGRKNFRHIAALRPNYKVTVNQLDGSLCGRTTKDEAFVTSAILGPQGVRTIILVTDRPHMLRAYLTFRGRGFNVIPHPIELSDVSSARRSMLTLREYAGLVSYLLLGRLEPGSAETLRQPDAELVQDVKRRGCEVTPDARPELFQASHSMPWN